MIEIEYEVGASKAELRELFAAEVDDEELVARHDKPWRSRGLEAPRRTVRQLRTSALADFLEHAKQPASKHVLTLKEAAPVLGLSERSLRHAVDQGDYDEELTETSSGLRALPFAETTRVWHVPRPRQPDPRVVSLMKQKAIEPGELFAPGYRRRHDGAEWDPRW